MSPTRKSANQTSTASPASLARRKFINSVAAAAGGGCLLALGAGLWARQASALPAQAIRPPGALAEHDFLGACIRCGLCVRDCPPQNLRLAGGGHGFGLQLLALQLDQDLGVLRQLDALQRQRHRVQPALPTLAAGQALPTARLILASSAMRFFLLCRRPAVSMMTTSQACDCE